MSVEIRIRLASEKAEEYIAYLATFSDEKLENHLDIIHQQSVIAEKEKLTSSLELLEIWREQVIQARILKAEKNIPTQPSAIELALAEMEAQEEKSEQRQEILREVSSKRITNKEEESQMQEKGNPDNSEQLSLF